MAGETGGTSGGAGGVNFNGNWSQWASLFMGASQGGQSGGGQKNSAWYEAGSMKTFGLNNDNYSSQLEGRTTAEAAKKNGDIIKQAPSGQGGFNEFMVGMKAGYAVGNTIFGTINAYRAAKSEKAILGMQQTLSEIQEKTYQTAAEDALRSGHQAVAAITWQAGQAKSSKRVSQAARGIAVSASGSAAETMTDIDISKEMNVNQTMANAITTSFGYRRAQTNQKINTLSIQAAKKSISPWAAAFVAHVQSAMEGAPDVANAFAGGGGGAGGK